MAICCIERQQQQTEVGIYGLQMPVQESLTLITPDLHKRVENTQTVRAVIFDIPVPITTFSRERFCKPFLQTIRCHALLWELGIQHGDISDTNLMVDPDSDKGILTDFDLATIVDKDATDPLHGADRTGTMAFMSVELLEGDGQQGKIPRLYRHDLESFCWVLFWICYCYENGKLRPRYPCTEWINVTPSICGAVKGGVLNRMRKVTATKSYIQYQSSLHRLMGYWSQFYVTMGFSKLDKSTSIEDVGSNLDLSHWDDIVEEDFEEPSDFQVRCAILNRLPQSKEVVMPWPRARGHVPTAIL